MSVNFTVAACRNTLHDPEFGICDDRPDGVAYTKTIDKSTWGATVINRREKQLVFTAVDKCVIQDAEYPGRGRCDGILTSDEHLYFIELKNQREGWRPDAIDQLDSTIRFYQESHERHFSEFRHKKAFVCNRRHPHFQVIDHELNLRFFTTYKVRIDIQAAIVVV